MLAPFASKSSLKLIHIRQGYVLPWREQVWVWQKTDTKWESYWTTDAAPNDDIRQVMFNHFCCAHETFQLREEFCCFVEWAFSETGISSLQTIAVGDHSPAFEQLDSQIFFQRNTAGGFHIISRSSKKWRYIAEENATLLQSCPKLRLL